MGRQVGGQAAVSLSIHAYSQNEEVHLEFTARTMCTFTLVCEAICMHGNTTDHKLFITTMHNAPLEYLGGHSIGEMEWLFY